MPFDEKKAQQVVDWFPKYLRLTEGRWDGKPFKLLPWQIEKVIKPLFGTIKDNGYRQYRTVYVEVPKKNGKSPLAAGIALRLLFADDEPGPHIYGAAGDREQASIVFDIAAKMVRKNPKLYNRCRVLDTTKRIIHNTNGGFYKVLSAESYTKHGVNAHGIVFDEIHAQPDRRLWDTLTEGSGAARTQPVIFAITQAGFRNESIGWTIHNKALQVRDGIIEDPAFLPVIYGAEETDDWTSEETWKKTNPSYGIILDPDDFRHDFNATQGDPVAEANFKRKRLNMWGYSDVESYYSMDAWDKCGQPFNCEILKGRKCFGGLDLASTIDIAALVLAFPFDNWIDLLCRFWVPEKTVRKQTKTEETNYDLWVRQGYLQTTPGNVIDYDYIEKDIQKLGTEYQIQEIGFDPWGALQIAPHLENMGFTVMSTRQGFITMSPPMKESLRLMQGGRLRHGGNPVLRWMAKNTVASLDPAENVKPNKQKSTGRIDGIVAMIMALDRLYRNEIENKDVEIWAV
jgi:phage terminase large subunit-like protein